jgi:hypothetical protein
VRYRSDDDDDKDDMEERERSDSDLDDVTANLRGVDVDFKETGRGWERIVAWTSKKTGLSPSKLEKYGIKTWATVVSLAKIGRPDIPLPPGLEANFRQKEMRYFGLDESGAARVSRKLRGLLELDQYVKASGRDVRIGSLCDRGIVSVALYKHYEEPWNTNTNNKGAQEDG